MIIGPIDHSTWYCMRQCRESVSYLKSKCDPYYEPEIIEETKLYNHYMKSLKKDYSESSN